MTAPIPRQRDHGSAGTAGDRFRADPPPHEPTWQPWDWGLRPCCRVCGGDHQQKETTRA